MAHNPPLQESCPHLSNMGLPRLQLSQQRHCVHRSEECANASLGVCNSVLLLPALLLCSAVSIRQNKYCNLLQCSCQCASTPQINVIAWSLIWVVVNGHHRLKSWLGGTLTPSLCIQVGFNTPTPTQHIALGILSSQSSILRVGTPTKRVVPHFCGIYQQTASGKRISKWKVCTK